MSSATESNNKWRKNNRRVIQLTLTPEEDQMIRSGAESKKKSMTRYLIDLAKKDIGDFSAENKQGIPQGIPGEEKRR